MCFGAYGCRVQHATKINTPLTVFFILIGGESFVKISILRHHSTYLNWVIYESHFFFWFLLRAFPAVTRCHLKWNHSMIFKTCFFVYEKKCGLTWRLEIFFDEPHSMHILRLWWILIKSFRPTGHIDEHRFALTSHKKSHGNQCSMAKEFSWKNKLENKKT